MQFLETVYLDKDEIRARCLHYIDDLLKLRKQNPANQTLVGNLRILPPNHSQADGQSQTEEKIFPIYTGFTIIGRDERCDIKLENGVSSLHCMLEISADGSEVFLQDLYSTNGTYLGPLEYKMQEMKMYQISHNKLITIGSVGTSFTLAQPKSKTIKAEPEARRNLPHAWKLVKDDPGLGEPPIHSNASEKIPHISDQEDSDDEIAHRKMRSPTQSPLRHAVHYNNKSASSPSFRSHAQIPSTLIVQPLSIGSTQPLLTSTVDELTEGFSPAPQRNDRDSTPEISSTIPTNFRTPEPASFPPTMPTNVDPFAATVPIADQDFPRTILDPNAATIPISEQNTPDPFPATIPESGQNFEPKTSTNIPPTLITTKNNIPPTLIVNQNFSNDDYTDFDDAYYPTIPPETNNNNMDLENDANLPRADESEENENEEDVLQDTQPLVLWNSPEAAPLDLNVPDQNEASVNAVELNANVSGQEEISQQLIDNTGTSDLEPTLAVGGMLGDASDSDTEEDDNVVINQSDGRKSQEVLVSETSESLNGSIELNHSKLVGKRSVINSEDETDEELAVDEDTKPRANETEASGSSNKNGVEISKSKPERASSNPTQIYEKTTLNPEHERKEEPHMSENIPDSLEQGEMSTGEIIKSIKRDITTEVQGETKEDEVETTEEVAAEPEEPPAKRRGRGRGRGRVARGAKAKVPNTRVSKKPSESTEPMTSEMQPTTTDPAAKEADLKKETTVLSATDNETISSESDGNPVDVIEKLLGNSTNPSTKPVLTKTEISNDADGAVEPPALTSPQTKRRHSSESSEGTETSKASSREPPKSRAKREAKLSRTSTTETNLISPNVEDQNAEVFVTPLFSNRRAAQKAQQQIHKAFDSPYDGFEKKIQAWEMEKDIPPPATARTLRGRAKSEVRASEEKEETPVATPRRGRKRTNTDIKVEEDEKLTLTTPQKTPRSARSTRRGKMYVEPEETEFDDDDQDEISNDGSVSITSKRRRTPEMSPAFETTTPRSIRKNSASFSRNSSVPPTVFILFTGIKDEDLQKKQRLVTNLGGAYVTDYKDCTHLVTAGGILRTVKFLCALSTGKHILGTNWLEASRKEGRFVDEEGYIARDKKAEANYGFNLVESIRKARERIQNNNGTSDLLQGKKIYATPSVNLGKDDLRIIINAAGGELIDKLPRFDKKHLENIIVIADDKEKDLCSKLTRDGWKVYTKEILFTGIMRQEIDYDSNLIPTDTGRKRR
ncbi:PAX-interacting protein 1 [Nowakowskiella sp. JEL0407]|nr:PAX-interacting protein 1 [Nowakowskiella sp. JEL0407]